MSDIHEVPEPPALDDLDAPLEIARRTAETLLKANGFAARHEAVSAAIRYRRCGPGASGDHLLKPAQDHTAGPEEPDL